VKERPEDIIHEPLEGGWSIAQAKGQHAELKMTILRSKRSIVLIPLSDADLVVTRA